MMRVVYIYVRMAVLRDESNKHVHVNGVSNTD